MKKTFSILLCVLAATVTSWVWKGIPIKYTVDNPRSTTTLVSLEQKSSLPTSLFTVPK